MSRVAYSEFLNSFFGKLDKIDLMEDQDDEDEEEEDKGGQEQEDLRCRSALDQVTNSKKDESHIRSSMIKARIASKE